MDEKLVDAEVNVVEFTQEEREAARLEYKYGSPVFKQMRSMGVPEEKILQMMRQMEADETEKFAQVAARYNLDVKKTPKYQLKKLLEMEKELSYCDKCDGKTCPKKHYQYEIPGVKRLAGDIGIGWGLCLVGRMRRADERLPVEFRGMTFADFDLNLYEGEDAQAAAQALDLAKKVVTDGATNLYLYGTFGSGKTLLASLIAKAFLLKNRSVEFGTVAKLLGELKETFDDPTRRTGDVLNRFRYCDVLILDDVGAEQPTAWKIEQLFELVNARYADHKQLVITSNYTPDELHAELKKVNRVKAGQLMSRINSICEFGYTGETDIRFKLKKGAI